MFRLEANCFECSINGKYGLDVFLVSSVSDHFYDESLEKVKGLLEGLYVVDFDV